MGSTDVEGFVCTILVSVLGGHLGVAVQLVLKPSLWSLNKISDLFGRFIDYRSKFNSLL
jgi:hypothetical protein